MKGYRWYYKCQKCGTEGWIDEQTYRQLIETGRCMVCGSTAYVILHIDDCEHNDLMLE